MVSPTFIFMWIHRKVDSSGAVKINFSETLQMYFSEAVKMYFLGAAAVFSNCEGCPPLAMVTMGEQMVIAMEARRGRGGNSSPSRWAFPSNLHASQISKHQVELDRTGGPIGITLATDEGNAKSSKVGPIVISRFCIFILSIFNFVKFNDHHQNICDSTFKVLNHIFPSPAWLKVGWLSGPRQSNWETSSLKWTDPV